MHTFYAPALPAHGGLVELEADEAHHVKVRRLRPGEAVRLVDGAGGYACGRYERGATIAAEAKQIESEPAVRFAVFQAALPPERLDYALEKAVEAGADLLVVFLPERSGLGKRKPERADRWRRIAREAAKQCGRARFPEVEAAGALAEALAARPCDLLWLTDPAGARPEFPGGVARAGLVVGPEGGLTDAEKAAAQNAGAVPVKLGPWILRSETVAPAGLALLQYGYGSTRR